MSGLRIKGVALSGAIDAARFNRAAVEQLVPERLRKYLDDPPYAGDWYPVSDLLGLTEALRRAYFPEMPPREAFELMGALTMKRDVLGDPAVLHPAARKGPYQGVVSEGMDFELFHPRAIALWQLYFDEGEQKADRVGERAVRLRVVGATSPDERMCWLLLGFYRAMTATLGPDHRVEHTSCSAQADVECAYTVTFADDFDPGRLDAIGPWRPREGP